MTTLGQLLWEIRAAPRSVRAVCCWLRTRHPATLSAALMLTLCAAAAQPPASSRAAEIKQRLQTILAGPEFTAHQEGPSLAARIGEAIGNLLERLFRGLSLRSPYPDSGNLLTYVVITALLAAALIGLARVMLMVINATRGRSPTTRRPGTVFSEEVQVEDTSADPDSLMRAAFAARDAGDLERAYRLLFRALLLRLDRAGLVRYDKSRTNGDYLRSLRGSPHWARLRAVMEAYDAYRYGGRTPAAPDLEIVASLQDSVAAQAGLGGMVSPA